MVGGGGVIPRKLIATSCAGMSPDGLDILFHALEKEDSEWGRGHPPVRPSEMDNVDGPSAGFPLTIFINVGTRM